MTLGLISVEDGYFTNFSKLDTLHKTKKLLAFHFKSKLYLREDNSALIAFLLYQLSYWLY